MWSYCPNSGAAPAPAAAESLVPISTLLAWYFISEVIRNKQLHQSGAGAPESARADPKTPRGCQVCAESADTHNVQPHNPSHRSSNEQILVLVKNTTYVLNVSPGRQGQPTRTIWQTQKDIQTWEEDKAAIKFIHWKTKQDFCSLLIRGWFHKRDLRALPDIIVTHKLQLSHPNACVASTVLNFMCEMCQNKRRKCSHVATHSSQYVENLPKRAPGWIAISFHFIIHTDMGLMFGKRMLFCFALTNQ